MQRESENERGNEIELGEWWVEEDEGMKGKWKRKIREQIQRGRGKKKRKRKGVVTVDEDIIQRRGYSTRCHFTEKRLGVSWDFPMLQIQRGHIYRPYTLTYSHTDE